MFAVRRFSEPVGDCPRSAFDYPSTIHNVHQTKNIPYIPLTTPLTYSPLPPPPPRSQSKNPHLTLFPPQVSHSGFLRTAIAHAQFANADYRLFSFATPHINELTEWENTERLGGGMGWSKRGRVGIGEGDFPAAEDGWEEGRAVVGGGREMEEVPR